ncbi:MAG: hypothetical protein GY847_11140 [Proteobacteria bacterium]|nr:hypothetical protein [Pseudomonadota bacterium]
MGKKYCFRISLVCLTVFTGALFVFGACGKKVADEVEKSQAVGSNEVTEKPGVKESYTGIDRADFNRLAVHLNVPVFWISDSNENSAIDADEVVGLLFYQSETEWTQNGKFTEKFDAAWSEIENLGKSVGQASAIASARAKAGTALKELDKNNPIIVRTAYNNVPGRLTPVEVKRRTLVSQDLSQGRPTLVYTDLTKLTPAEKKMFVHLQKAASMIDELFARQTGASALIDKVPQDDTASQSLFRRNWGPKCTAPKTESNPECTAIPGAPKQIVDAYPAKMQEGDDFCEKLGKLPNAKELLSPFVVIREVEGELKAVPYTEAYKDVMTPLSLELNKAAEAIDDPKEEALKTYLLAAAKSFTDNNWIPADDAWSKMNAENSKWYLRVGPDETGWDPCSYKAGFHFTVALINSDSLVWQEKLKPVQQEMEQRMADLIGEPYKARKVSFHLPDFINIVTNSGEDRGALGATIGQSLPNWGTVSEEGRGRTVVMSNLYTDPDSMSIRRVQTASLLSGETMKSYTNDPAGSLLTIIIHEAAHNLGPLNNIHKYKGKKINEAFGGSLAVMVEELKAEASVLWYVDFLNKKKIIDDDLTAQAYTYYLSWAMGHIARGMYTPTKRPKPYSQLAAIQFGFLIDEGALEFNPDATAANGNDIGCFTLHLDKMPAAAHKLMEMVGKLKATNDKSKLDELLAKYVDGDAVPQAAIKERVLRSTKANFVYSYNI